MCTDTALTKILSARIPVIALPVFGTLYRSACTVTVCVDHVVDGHWITIIAGCTRFRSIRTEVIAILHTIAIQVIIRNSASTDARIRFIRIGRTSVQAI
jgi:hypothetical protein